MSKIKNRVLTVAKQQDLPPKSATNSKRFVKHGDAMFRFLFDPAAAQTKRSMANFLRQERRQKSMRLTCSNRLSWAELTDPRELRWMSSVWNISRS